MATSRNRVKIHVVYNKGKNGVTGVEFSLGMKEGQKGNVGRIVLRFFKTGKSVRFVAEPEEAYQIAHAIEVAARSKGPFRGGPPPHKFVNKSEGNKEITTSVGIERWERDGKIGISLMCSRGEDKFSIGLCMTKESDFPVAVGRALFVADFLRELARSSAWAEGEIDHEEAGRHSAASDDSAEPPAQQNRPASPQSGQSKESDYQDKRIVALDLLLRETKANVTGFLRYFGTSALKDFPLSRYNEAVAMLNQKKANNQARPGAR